MRIHGGEGLLFHYRPSTSTHSRAHRLIILLRSMMPNFSQVYPIDDILQIVQRPVHHVYFRVRTIAQEDEEQSTLSRHSQRLASPRASPRASGTAGHQSIRGRPVKIYVLANKASAAPKSAVRIFNVGAPTQARPTASAS